MLNLGALDTTEAIKNVRHLVCGDANAGITHLDHDLV